MSVESTHRDHSNRMPQWRRCRHAVSGTDAIKGQAETYLPKLSGQLPAEYNAYLARAMWYGATGRTIQGLVGAIMRKPPTINVPDTMVPMLEDITLTGVPIASFAKWVLNELLISGRAGVLVDMPRIEQKEARPYVVGYEAENIINWRVEIINGAPAVTLVVLQEEKSVIDSADLFMTTVETQYRVLKLVDGVFVIEIWNKGTPGSKHEAQFIRSSEITPVVRGKTMDFIPFCFFGPNTIEAGIEKSPILDLVDVNLSHYKNSADLEHGLHFTALPTVWVAGFSAKEGLTIGSSEAWVTQNTDAKVGMIEFKGDGLGTIERSLESKERQMAVLGARLLEERTGQVEAAITISTRNAGERSVLAAIGQTVGLGFTKILGWYADIIGVPSTDVSLGMNDDFIGAPMSSQELSSLMQTWQSGGMSWPTFYYNLQRGELSRPGIDSETERVLIEEEAASMSLTLGNSDDDESINPDMDEGEDNA